MAKTIKPLELNEDFRYTFDAIEKKGKNVFVSGKAGTGKSTFLSWLLKATRRNVVALAPTGVAALNIKGQTIHSFFGFPPKMFLASELRRPAKSKLALFKKMEILVIDEISMVRADLLDNIDLFLRKHRKNSAPFGGVQVVFVGDLFQLPPVVRGEERFVLEHRYKTPFFFSADVFREGLEMEYIEFGRTYRQENIRFLRLLNAIRTARADYEELEELNERYMTDFQADNYITLTSTNAIAGAINQKEMDRLTTPIHTYVAKIEGKFDSRLYPTGQFLALKEGAQVMFLRNDPERQFFNGLIGRVVKLSSDSIKVEVQTGETTEVISVPQATWEVMKYKLEEDGSRITTETVGAFTQYPLKPAWAITIHKSQGKTFDKVIIDLGRGAFAHGQLYVALSRCRTLEGIVLRQKITQRDIIIDEAVVDFYEQYLR